MKLPDLDIRPVLAPVLRQVLERDATIAVTGLARAGKTVFTTALVHNLMLAPGRGAELLPFLRPAREGRIAAVTLDEQGARPFPFASCLGALTAQPSSWPPSTRGVSELTMRIDYRVANPILKHAAPTSRLTLHIVDYPGEWLLDLPLLQQTHAQWSDDTLALCRAAPRAAFAQEFLGALDAIDPASPASDETLARLAGLYRDFLRRCRDSDSGIVMLQPGRFLAPGDLHENDRLLQFCPLPARAGALAREAARRYDAYRSAVVERFYRDHFRRFTRQIVLVDILSALAKGPVAVAETQLALKRLFDNFHARRGSILQRLFGARTERLLFACSKADHITSGQYGNLRNLLRALVEPQAVQMHESGAAIGYEIVAAVKCTHNLRNAHGTPILRGRPLGASGERDLDPGDIPETLPGAAEWPELRLGAFAPPAMPDATTRGLPSVYLDRAAAFLIEDLFR
jgi:predicted YcjX-like family ATPase